MAAFGEGFAPLPFSDALALVPTQLTMIASITAVYGANLEKSTMRAILTSLLGTTVTTNVGKTIASNLLKCIPGVGTVAGGLISGTTAATLTVALGRTYVVIMDQLAKGEITVSQLLDKNVQAKFNKDYLNLLKDKNTEKEAKKIRKEAKKS